MAAAAQWFTLCLDGIDGAEAREYLRKRGISGDTIRAFGIGFAPDSRGRLRRALSAFGDDRLIDGGLLISVEDREPYDRFRGRVIIPIRDARGRVIAFGGRIIGDGEPKYLNSPETPLFDKGRTLFNLDRASPAARRSGRLIVAEGYMDVIALAQAGIDEAVAPLGTALTEEQIVRMWRLADVPILCFDGDPAGQKAALRAALRALPLLEPGRSLGFATLPAGKDPDDVVRHAGRQAFEALIDQARPLVDLLWEGERDLSPLRTPEDRAGLRHRLAELARSIRNDNVRNLYQDEFRRRFDEQFRALRPMARAARPGGGLPLHPSVAGEARDIGGAGMDPAFSRAILAGLLRHPTIIPICAEALTMLTIADAELDRLRMLLLDSAYDGVPLETEALLPICANAGMGELAHKLLNANGLAFSFARRQADGEIARRDLGMAIEALAARPALDMALAAATARLSEHWDEHGFAEQVRLREALGEANRRLSELAQADDKSV
jgi:DNA primase